MTMTTLHSRPVAAETSIRQPFALDLRSHRRLRGPYTAGGELLRRVVPELTAVDPARVKPMATAVVAIAPDLEGGIPARPQTLTDLADGDERTRFYPVLRTRDLSYLVSELVRVWAETCHPGGVLLRFWELADADPTDTELVRMIQRRIDETAVLATDAGSPFVPVGEVRDADPAQCYIDADGTSRDPALRSAYDHLGEQDRARRHGARAELLIERAEPGFHLGAIPYHLERGEAPQEAVTWLVEGQNQAFREGFYESAVDLGRRGRALVSWDEDPKIHNYLTKRVIGGLTYLSRADEAMAVIGEHRLTTTETSEQMNDAYMMAMIYTRHLGPERIDQDAALAWVNTALAIADAEQDPTKRAFYRAFMRNARALVEMHRGDLAGSLTLVEESIKIADDHLGEQHELHRTVLLTNRARVLLALGHHDRALPAFNEVLTRDPEYDALYFERAVALKAVGDLDGALRDLDRAIELGVAFTEAYYNRADILTDLGHEEQALASLSTLLDIDPEYIDARLNRAVLLMGAGDLAGAAADLEKGLAINPDNAELWSAQGLLRTEQGRETEALQSYDEALRRKPGLVQVYANRAVLHFSAGRVGDAVADLDQAIELADTAELRVNRGIGLHELGDYSGAVADYGIALASGDADPAEVLFRRGLSRRAGGDLLAAEADWRQHLDLMARCGEASEHAAEIADLMTGPTADLAQASSLVGGTAR
jgi:tetratricopeptide (TPR) repeat protein